MKIETNRKNKKYKFNTFIPHEKTILLYENVVEKHNTKTHIHTPTHIQGYY